MRLEKHVLILGQQEISACYSKQLNCWTVASLQEKAQKTTWNHGGFNKY